MATTTLNRPGSEHAFYWTGPAPDVGTVLVTDRAVGYLVRRVRPSRVLRAVVLHVTCVDPYHPSLTHRPRVRWLWRGLHGHPKELGRTVTDVADVARAAARLLRR